MIEDWKEGNRSIGITLPERAYKGRYLQLHEKLTKAESSVLIQARTGKIGLRAFLFQRRVPSILTPICQCGEGSQTAEHLFYECTAERSRDMRALGLQTKEEVRKELSNPKMAATLVRLLLYSGWLNKYRLAKELQARECLEAWKAGWKAKPPPERAKRRRRRRPAP